MKTTCLLHDEATQPTQLLANALPANVPREIETVAACNCDRWGHPCSGFVERIVSTGTRASDFNAHEEMR